MTSLPNMVLKLCAPNLGCASGHSAKYIGPLVETMLLLGAVRVPVIRRK